MTLRDTSNQYGIITKTLHWLTAILMSFQLFLGVYSGYAPITSIKSIMFWHKSLGLLLLAIALIWVLWRLTNPKPNYPQSMQRWEFIAARLGQTLLYTLLIVMPLTGWIMSTAAGYIPSFFGFFNVPAPMINLNHQVASINHELHEFFAWSLVVLIAIHFSAALKHHFINKDNVLQKMF